MITPRRTRLVRVPDLAGFRAELVALVSGSDRDAAHTFVLVPTRAAGEQLRRTLVARLGDATGNLPLIGSRGDLYQELNARLEPHGRWVPDVEREAMLEAAARDAEEAGAAPPFHVRPGLVAEMVALYDRTRRLHRTIDDFERLLLGELQDAAETDRGAAQLLEQTRFLVAAFRGYEQRLREGRSEDEHGVRQRLLSFAAEQPVRHVVVTVADWRADAYGLWPADDALLTGLPGLERVDIIATESMLDAGYRERLMRSFVGLEEYGEVAPSPRPVLVVPASGPGGEARWALSYRDREDELEGVARRLCRDGDRSPNTRSVGLVVARPLPYLYLAREVFGGAAVAFDALDTLPLAAEPYAAAIDVALEFVAAAFSRRATIALLRSPHFRFRHGEADVQAASISALDRAMSEHRYLGGLERLESMAGAWIGPEQPAAGCAVALARLLAPLAESRPLVDQLDLFRAFMDVHDREPALDSTLAERRERARSAVRLTLDALGDAYRRQDPSAAGNVSDLSATIRRWLGGQTFSLRTSAVSTSVQIVDAQAVRYGDFDELQLMGLVDGDWPERPRRNIFFPPSLLAELEPSRPDRIQLNQERDVVRFSRAIFRDLVGSATRRTRVSTFSLEADSVVEPSPFVDDLAAFGLETTQEAEDVAGGTFTYERLAAGSVPGDRLSASASRWARARLAGAARDPSRFEGQAGPWTLPRVSVSRLERYLKCPFQFFAANVLQIEEEPEDENTRSPLERGRFLHEIFETFFHEWQARGHARITPANLDEARRLFAEAADPALASLSPAEAALERARLFGSAVGSGIADRVFAMEAGRGTDIRERLMEYELDGEFTFAGADGARRPVRLRAKIDRVDLLQDGTFRLIDYKTRFVPDRKTALQLPIYSACVAASLSQQRGRVVRASEAMYLSFEGPQAVTVLEERGKPFDELVAAAEVRLVAALDGIAAGDYPPRPETRSLCNNCGFVTVCRTPGGLDESRSAEPSGQHD